jgi:hypothetical protein
MLVVPSPPKPIFNLAVNLLWTLQNITPLLICQALGMLIFIFYLILAKKIIHIHISSTTNQHFTHFQKRLKTFIAPARQIGYN